MLASNLSALKTLFKRLLIVAICFQLTRIIFHLVNQHLFSESIQLSTLWYGFRFDAVSISYLMAPFIFLSIIPLDVNKYKTYRTILKVLFHLGNGLGLLINLIDVGYYSFSLKRSTAGFFDIVATGNDFWKLLPSYLSDFWYLLLCLLALMYLSELAYRKSESFTHEKPSSPTNYFVKSAAFLLTLGLTVIGFRGGIQLRPLDIINANQYGTQLSATILNTPFTIIKTVRNQQIAPINYFNEAELNKIYTPYLNIKPNQNFNAKGKNVVFVILESFAKEYVGYYNNGKGYTPFLDSLARESYVFNNAFANGSRSIEALPSIFSSIPPLISKPIVLSDFANNKLDALPNILVQNGYNTSFYHGGENGTMEFDGYAGIAGFQEYNGKDQYPNAIEDYDGNWGIFDEPYLQYFGKELGQKKEPFLSCIFTLSSHHPYTVPNKYKNVFPKGTQPAHETIGYTDYSIKQFFKNVENQPWYKNTLFVFTADHSAPSSSPKYTSLIGRYAIPFFVFDPSGEIKGKNEAYFQHIDITPTILELLGIETKLVSFGRPVSSNDRFVINYANNTYQFYYNNYLTLFDGENVTGFYQIKNLVLGKNLLNQKKIESVLIEHEQKLKAIIQQYTNGLINNKLSIQTIHH